MSTPPSGSAEGGSAAWPEVDGLAEPEDGAAEAAASELDGSGEVEGAVQPRGRRCCRASACNAR